MVDGPGSNKKQDDSGNLSPTTANTNQSPRPSTSLSLTTGTLMASSSRPPPPPSPPTPPPLRVATEGVGPSLSLSLTPKKRKTAICPICKKDLCHEKALCGHIRWHSKDERDAASVAIAQALAAAISFGGESEEEDGGTAKRFKLPDLNKSPPPEEDGAA